MEMLGPPETHYLSAALGWMELGNPTEAKSELARLNPQWAHHPAVLEVKWAIFASEQNWIEALEVAEVLVRSDPNRASGWLHRAYALRRTPRGGLSAAWQALLPAVDRFPEESTIPYNLACYACQMSDLEEARRWVRRAMAVGGETRIKAMASADQDLAPLWSEIAKF